MANAALVEQKRALAEARLSDLALPDGEAPKARAAREEARSRLRDMGLSHPRDEYWKFTRPESLTAAEATPAALSDAHSDERGFEEIDCLRIVFVDGVFDASQSDPLDMAGLEIAHLSDALRDAGHWVQDAYGAIEAAGHDPIARPLAAMNTASAGAGIVIHATGKAEKPISFKYLRRDSRADITLHHVVRVEPGADLTILEYGPAAARLSKVIEVDVADDGAFHHVRAQGHDPERRAFTATFGRLGARATFKSFTLTMNGALTRNECVLTLTGDDAIAHVAGACMGDGTGFHHDDTVFVTHDALNCESRQVFKKVLRNGATGAFQGKILVQPGAQKTDGYQISQALLLDGDSQFLVKPELEIYADDVECSHGSTCGAIDDEALFYLRSRGVSEQAATNLLTLAFLSEALDEIEDPRLADDLRARLEGWLTRHRTA